MFTGIKPTGTLPVSGIPSYSPSAPSAGQLRTGHQNYDQFLCSPQPTGEEGRVRAMEAQISQSVRIRPTRHEIAQLQQQIQDGTYQPDAREIAARMLLIDLQEG